MSKQNIALITGITGQDGSYLAELLLEKVMMYTVLSAVRLSIIVSASLILKVSRIFIFIMPILVTLCQSLV